MTPAIVHVRRAVPGRAHRAVTDLAAEVTGGSAFRLIHACAHCGSSSHGRPVALASRGSFVHVSLSRARDCSLAVVAACLTAPVGIDIEADGAAAFDGFDAVALHPREHCSDDAERARLWVRKEALLKAHGTGLVADPRGVRLGDDGTVLNGPTGTIADVDAGAGWACAVAVADSGPVQAQWT